MQIKPISKELIYVISLLFGMGVTWGSLAAKVSAQGEIVKLVPAIATKQAVTDTKLDYIIGLIESQQGIRRRRPQRPDGLDQQSP